MVKWQYLVEDIYEDCTFIPAKVPVGRLMTVAERAESYNLFALGKKAVKSWNMIEYLQARGKQGWELVQAQRLTTGNEYEPSYWKCFLKRPVPPAEPAE